MYHSINLSHYILSFQTSLSAIGRTYEVKGCTRKAVFQSTLATIPVPKLIISSVLANFICDASRDDDILASANREISDHVEALNTYCLANPDVAVAVAPPLPRSVPDWFLAYLPVFSTFLFHEVSRLSNPRLKYMAPFVAPPTFFESDGIHLNADAGATFIQYLVSSADLLFPDVGAPAVEVSATVTSNNEASVDALSKLSRDVSDLRSEFQRRRCQDNLVFARIKEDKDFEFNKAREDRCTISGITVTTAPPQDPKERKDFFKNLISDLVTEALPDPDVPPQVLDVLVNMRTGRGPPYFEVKFDSVASSLSFRVAASKLAKAGTGSFKGVFVSNTVNLSTRIRIDILKLLAKRLTTPTEFSYVQGFSSRPVLHYLMRAVEGAPLLPATGTGRSYTFAESVERWGDLLSRQSLEPIRRKALQAFSGCLEQYFVVLKETAAESEPDIFSRLLASGSQRSRAPPLRGSRRGRLYRGRGTLTGSNLIPRNPEIRLSVNVPQEPESQTTASLLPSELSSQTPATLPTPLVRDLKRGPSPGHDEESEPLKKK